MRANMRGSIAILSLLITLRIPASAAAGDAARVLVQPLPEAGQPVAARPGAADRVHVLYDSSQGPRYVTFSTKNREFSAPLPVVEAGAQASGLKFAGADLAVGPGEWVHVALSSNAWQLRRPTREWGFYYTRLAPGASRFAPLRNLNATPSEGFSLAADRQGRVTACWLSGKLFANLSVDQGQTFGPNREINPVYDPCNCCTTSAVYLADGLLALLYREETNNERDMYLVFWDQKNNQTWRTRVSSTPWKITTCPMTYYALQRTSTGLLAVWPTGENYDIYFAHLDFQGKQQPPGEIRVPGRSGPRRGLLALSAADGVSLVLWNREEHLHWQLYDRQGRLLGREGSVGSAGSGAAGVVTPEGKFIIFRSR
jgi:hypothetical protein